MAELVGFFAGQGYTKAQEVALEEAFQHWLALDNAADPYADEDKNTRAETAWSEFSALRLHYEDVNMRDDIALNAPPGY
jgi:hypothetical protein